MNDFKLASLSVEYILITFFPFALYPSPVFTPVPQLSRRRCAVRGFIVLYRCACDECNDYGPCVITENEEAN